MITWMLKMMAERMPPMMGEKNQESTTGRKPEVKGKEPWGLYLRRSTEWRRGSAPRRLEASFVSLDFLKAKRLLQGHDSAHQITPPMPP
jgi:hypothetical protein